MRRYVRISYIININVKAAKTPQTAAENPLSDKTKKTKAHITAGRLIKIRIKDFLADKDILKLITEVANENNN